MNRLSRCLALAFAALLFLHARPAAAQVYDNASIFSPAARDKANAAMTDLEHRHGKQFVVETFASVPADQQDQLQQLGKEKFFTQWMGERGKQLGVNGVYMLICMDPKYLVGGVGRNTREHGDFTLDNLNSLREKMQGDFHTNNFDAGLADGVSYVDQAFTANIHTPAAQGGSTNYAPAPYANSPTYSHSDGGGGTSLGMILCAVVGLIIVISLIRSVFYGGGGGGYGGGGYMPPGPGGYMPGPGYGGYGGYGGGGGSGFGRGFLGGLLGGALGGYAENRFFGGGQSSGGGGFLGGGGGGGSTSGGGFQAPSSSFDPGPSDAGTGFGDSSSGGDFGSSGGGSGGGDSGGSF